MNSFRTCMYCGQRSQYIRLNSKKNNFRRNYSRKYGGQIFSSLKFSNFAWWKNSLEYLWCRYNSLPLSIIYTQVTSHLFVCFDLNSKVVCIWYEKILTKTIHEKVQNSGLVVSIPPLTNKISSFRTMLELHALFELMFA